jgi:ABC-type Fe3+-hydroxamate transport system substrate-binding protein
VRRRDFSAWAPAQSPAWGSRPPFAEAKLFTDSDGRKVNVPDEVHRVFPAGPPASVTLFTLAPEKMLGWSRAPSPEAQPFLPARYADLPEIGRLTGRGNTINLEDVARLAPDLVLDVGSTTANYASLADQVQEQTHIPAVLISGRLAETPPTLRTVGDLHGVSLACGGARRLRRGYIEPRSRGDREDPSNRAAQHLCRTRANRPRGGGRRLDRQRGR